MREEITKRSFYIFNLLASPPIPPLTGGTAALLGAAGAWLGTGAGEFRDFPVSKDRYRTKKGESAVVVLCVSAQSTVEGSSSINRE